MIRSMTKVRRQVDVSPAARACLWSLAATIVVASGCQAKNERVAVTGNVTYDGEAVADGQIAFEPKGRGKMEFARINEGRYSLPVEYGLLPGEYLVRITGNRASGKLAQSDAFLDGADSLEIVDQYIPLKYNSGSQLTVTIEQAERVERDFMLAP